MHDFMTPPADALMTPWGPIWLSAEGVVMNIGTNSSQTKEEVAEYLSYIKKAAGGKPRPLLIEISLVRNASKELREEYDRQKFDELVTATALVTGTSISNMIGNIIIGITKSKLPVKLFTNPTKAREWLLQYTNNTP